MEQHQQQACLNELQQLWLTAHENLRPFTVWIAEHSSISSAENALDTPVKNAWLLSSKGIEQRPAIDFVRFITVQSGTHWVSGISNSPKSAVFNDRPFHIHSIGLAAFAPIKNSETIYLEYAWGGANGRGAIYTFNPQTERIDCIKNVLIS